MASKRLKKLPNIECDKASGAERLSDYSSHQYIAVALNYEGITLYLFFHVLAGLT
jgi:hypothetical protein